MSRPFRSGSPSGVQSTRPGKCGRRDYPRHGWGRGPCPSVLYSSRRRDLVLLFSSYLGVRKDHVAVSSGFIYVSARGCVRFDPTLAVLSFLLHCRSFSWQMRRRRTFRSLNRDKLTPPSCLSSGLRDRRSQDIVSGRIE